MDDAAEYEEMNRGIIREFRERGGQAGGWFEGKPLILLHHVGAKSGKDRVAPLVPLFKGDRIFVFASKGGSESNPDWFYNLVAHPATRIELGTEIVPVTARVLEGAERDIAYSEQSSLQPQFAEYERKTARKIPVVELVREARAD